MSETNGAAEKPMPQKDRTELRRILNARFEILTQQLHEREHEVRQELQRAIEEQHEAAVKEARRKSLALRKEADKIVAEITAFEAKIIAKAEALFTKGQELTDEMRGKGVVPLDNESYYHHRTVNRAVNVNKDYWYSPDSFISVAGDWQPDKLKERVNKGFAEISRQAGLHKLDLRMQQLELSEELAVGSLSSDKAKDFLGKIPNIDNLLPAADDTVTKALVASTSETVNSES